MKRVIIAVDFSPVAQKVTEAGYSVAKSMQATVALVHVVADVSYYAMEYSPLMGYTGLGGDNARQLAVDLKQEARNFVQATAQHLGDQNIETFVLEGDAADAILDFSIDWKADLIVMGAHSRGALDILVGNVTSGVLKKTKVPVLVIPED
jgi:nucleotide-binding universal stress UspA family protein